MPKEVLDDYTENEDLDEAESTEEYSEYRAKTKEALEEQWHDLAIAGVIFMLYKTFPNIIGYGRENVKEEEYARALEYVSAQAYRKLQTIGGINSYAADTKKYLLSLMNRFGDKEFQRVFGPDVSSKYPKFNLTSLFHRQRINERAQVLIDGIDKSTSERFGVKILSGMLDGKTKQELLKEILEQNSSINAVRAERILRTETAAGIEYIRHEVAKRNGVAKKMWLTTLDEKVCPVCGPMHKQEVNINEAFSNGLDYPPVHPHCRCYVSYDYSNSLCSNSVDGKFGKEYNFYQSEETTSSCINPNAVWNGGNGLVGADKNVADYYESISRYGKEVYTNAWKELNTKGVSKGIDSFSKELVGLDSTILEDTNKLRSWIENSKMTSDLKLKFMSLSDVQLSFVGKRVLLSDDGFVQMMKSLGIRGKIPAKNFGITSFAESKIDIPGIDEFIQRYDENRKMKRQNEITDTMLENFSKKNKLTIEETKALSSYTIDPNNAYLRSGRTDLEFANAEIKLIDSALEKANKYEGTVYRFIRPEYDWKQPNSFYRSLSDWDWGTTFTDKSYISTTSDLNVLIKDKEIKSLFPLKKRYKYEMTTDDGVSHPNLYIFKIQSKRGVLIQDISGYKTQKEVLLPRGTTYRVGYTESKTAKELFPDKFPDEFDYLGKIIPSGEARITIIELEEVVEKSDVSSKYNDGIDKCDAIYLVKTSFNL